MKLSLYNFTVFDLRLKKGHCYLWTEVDAHKGSNEIGSNVNSFIETKVAEGIREFVFWSDSPASQNRNRMMFSMHLRAACKHKIRITHRFLETGHSYSEADSMHARIEMESRNKNVFAPSEWKSIIASAKQDGKPYIVNDLNTEDVLNLHVLVDKEHWDFDVNNRQVRWTEVREVVADHKFNCNEIQYWYSFTEPRKRLRKCSTSLTLRSAHAQLSGRDSITRQLAVPHPLNGSSGIPYYWGRIRIGP